MISFFPDIYPNEIFYSTVARYHKRSGNIDFSHTSSELFGRAYKVSTVDMPNDLEFLVSQLPKDLGYTSDIIIKKHTLFNCYAPFIKQDNKLRIIETMKCGDGRIINSLSGQSTRNQLKRQYLYYCPKCAQEDYERYGESYFHRLHQAPGVLICNTHRCLLNIYTKILNQSDKRIHHDCDYDILDLNVYFDDDKNYEQELLNISNSYKYLLENNLDKFNQDEIYKKYKYFLEQKDLFDSKKTIKQNDLCNQFKRYYSERLLNKLNCNIKKDDRNSWLKKISRKPEFSLEPIRNILFIQFLSGDIQNFFSEESIKNENIKELNFHQKKYIYRNKLKEYMNRYPNHKRTHIIKNVTNEYIWIRENDKEWFENNLPKPVVQSYKSKQILDICKNKILEYISENPGCNRAAIIKKLRNEYEQCRRYDKGWFEENILKSTKNLKPNYYIERKEIYRDSIERYIKENPNCNRTEVRENLKKEYNWIFNHDIEWLNNILSNTIKVRLDIKNKYRDEYGKKILEYIMNNNIRHRTDISRQMPKEYKWFYMNDKEWIEQNMPKAIEHGQRNTKKKSNVDWEERDEIILKEVKECYKEAINNNRKKISKSYLANMLKPQYQTSVKSYLDKIPRTKEYIDSIIETREQYCIRKIKWVIHKLYIEEMELNITNVKRLINISSLKSLEFNKYIEECINSYDLNEYKDFRID